MLAKLRTLDENADHLFPKLLTVAKVSIDRHSREIVRDKAGEVFMGLALPDLMFRLGCQQAQERRLSDLAPQDAIERAKIWRHVAEACKPGDAIPDISDQAQLNPWLPEGYPKFAGEMPTRNCVSCGLPWDVCANRYQIVSQPLDGSPAPRQLDPRKPWLCKWCYDQPAVLKQYNIFLPPTAFKKRIRGSQIARERVWAANAG